MAYNPLDVSTGKGNTESGPLWYNPTIQTEKLTFDETFSAGAGWVRLGEGSTDGVESTQEASSSDKNVWGGKNLGTIFSEFKDTAIVGFASSYDPAVLGVVFGKDNVKVSDDEILTIVKSRTPGFGTFVFLTKLDDGRDHWLVIPAGQPDPNLTQTYNDSDIVVTSTTLVCAEREITITGEDEATSFFGTSYRITEPISS